MARTMAQQISSQKPTDRGMRGVGSAPKSWETKGEVVADMVARFAIVPLD